MTQLFQLFVAAIGIAVILATIAVWSRRRTWIKVFAVAIAALYMPVAYAGFSDLLSKPKPVSLEWARRADNEATVLSAIMKEGEGIYLWLRLDGVNEPRSYVLPWDLETAKQLQEAMREAEANQNGLRMRLPFANSLDPEEPKFYALPQPEMPSKDQIDGPTVYSHPSFEA